MGSKIQNRWVKGVLAVVAAGVVVGGSAGLGSAVWALESNATTVATNSQQQPASKLLPSVLESHGGLNRFRSLGSFSYRIEGFPLTPQAAVGHDVTIDLGKRAIRVDSPVFTAAHDGAAVTWIKPDVNAIGLPPKFFTKGSTYFVLMPFVFGDGGVISQDTAPITYKGVTYDTVTLYYQDGVGDVNDEYVLLVDRKTRQLAVINHTVKGAGIERVTWEFNDWQKVEGLLVPQKLTFYPGWNPENPGEGKSATVSNVKVGKAAPDAALFAQPADAVASDK